MQPAGELEILLPLAISKNPTLGVSIRNHTTFSGIATRCRRLSLPGALGHPSKPSQELSALHSSVKRSVMLCGTAPRHSKVQSATPLWEHLTWPSKLYLSRAQTALAAAAAPWTR